MATPAQAAISLWRGNDDPSVIWAFGPDGHPDDLTGSEFRLDVTWPAAGGQSAGSLSAASTAGSLSVDLPTGRVTWPYTLADIEAIPRGARPVYELKRLIGGHVRTLVWGQVVIQSPQGG